jgi:putative lipoic acid-binding regulatory protein
MWSEDMQRAVAGRGRPADPGDPDSRQRMLEAMAERHPFPGYYPVVVIGMAGEAFRLALVALLEEHESVDDYRFSERASSGGKYVSYHVEVFVAQAENALSLKEGLALLEGVRALL